MSKEEIEKVVKSLYAGSEALDADKPDENFTRTESLTAFGTDEDGFF